ncbi:7782_t:CDS:2 [Rhizophagus irregularis]|nr:7782_t:CDS:2 [Rhizophagus irregularis]
MGQYFFTFSAIDMYWPELHKLMENNDHNGDEAESSKCQLLVLIRVAARGSNKDEMNNVIQYFD